MTNKRKAFVLLSVGVALLLPALALAQGIVPCNGLDCNLCSLAELVQGIINKLIYLAVPLSACLFAYAGFLIFTSKDDSHKIARGKEILVDVLIGFVIALSGWLVVQTIVNIVVDKSFWGQGSSWNQIQCVSSVGTGKGQRLNGTNLSDVLNNALGTVPTQTSNVEGKGDLYGTNNISNTSQQLPQCSNQYCDPSVLANAGFNTSQANVMSCIAITENGGTPGGCNGNACGMFQIMLTQNPLVGPDCGGTLDCKSMCKGANGVAASTAACQPCVQAASNAACNAEAAHYLYTTSGYAPWVGLSDNTKSASCVAQYSNSN